jgi:hypothetical protein
MSKVDVSASEHPLIYRAITNPEWLKLKSNAFKLRRANRERSAETDLSMLLSVNCTKVTCDIGWKKCVGEFVLKTADVIDDGWRVVKDDPKGPSPRPKHAEILGLPLHGTDELEIELNASRLAALIDSVNPRPA